MTPPGMADNCCVQGCQHRQLDLTRTIRTSSTILRFLYLENSVRG